MYPEGHSMISQGLDSVLGVLREIFALKGQITIDMKNDALYVGKDILDKKNRNNRQFIKWLNDLYITSITLSRGLTRDELLKFQNILVMKTSDILVLGNIEKVFADSRIAHIKVKGLDLGYFSSTKKITDRESLKDKKPKVKDPDVSYLSSTDEKKTDDGKKTTDEKKTEREELEDKKQFEDELWRKFTSSLITQSTEKGEQKSRSPEYSNIDSHDFVKLLNEETIDWDVFLNDYRSMMIQYLRSEDEEKKTNV